MRVRHYLADWRTVAWIVGCLLVAGVVASIVLGGITAHDALEARDHTATAASRRIDQLNRRIKYLGDELVHAADKNGQRIGALTAEIAALQEQVRQLHGHPVVPATTTTSTTTPRHSSSTTSSTTSTTTPCRVSLLGTCVPTAKGA